MSGGFSAVSCGSVAAIQSTHLNRMRSRRRLCYSLVVLVLLLWLGITVVYASYLPQIYWFSYFSVDYSLGFVRRGLAGEIIGLAPADRYFTALLTFRWLVSALFIVSLAVAAWTVAVRFGRSERRLMLALLTPVLPFGFATAVYAPCPNLLAGAALAAFAVALCWARDRRRILFASAVYGCTTGLLTLIHEAIPFMYSLGAIAAIVALGVHSPIRVQRLSTLLAVAPGLVVALAIALLGQRGISSQLCARLPHQALNWPPAGQPSGHQSLLGQSFYVDYHDFVCRNIIPLFDQTAADGVRKVVNAGAVALAMSTALGVFLFMVTLLIINRISGVPIGRFCNVLRGRLVWVVFGFVLFLPLFAIAVDWTRWWVTMCFDVGLVYLLYASGQPVAAQPATRRTRILFALGIVLLACIPIGALANVGMTPPV